MRADRLILAGLEEGVWPQRRADRSLPVAARCARRWACRRPSAASACRPTTSPRPPARREVDPAPHRAARRRAGGEVALAVAAGDPGRAAPASTLPGRARASLRLGPRASTRPAGYAPGRARPRPDPAGRATARASCRSPASRRWIRDPYAVYARDILGLQPLDRPDEPVEARARGNAVHAAFERVVAAPGPTPCPRTAPTRSRPSAARTWTPPACEDHAMARETPLAREAAPLGGRAGARAPRARRDPADRADGRA